MCWLNIFLYVKAEDSEDRLSTKIKRRKLSRGMRFPTMWYVQTAKAQISLRIRAVWSEPLLVAWIF